MPTPAQVEGARNLTSDAPLAMPDLTAASDADKQKVGDMLLLQALLKQMMVDALKRTNPAGVNDAQEEIRTASRDMGLDLDQLEITANGLAPKPQQGRNRRHAAVGGAGGGVDHLDRHFRWAA